MEGAAAVRASASLWTRFGGWRALRVGGNDGGGARGSPGEKLALGPAAVSGAPRTQASREASFSAVSERLLRRIPLGYLDACFSCGAGRVARRAARAS